MPSGLATHFLEVGGLADALPFAGVPTGASASTSSSSSLSALCGAASASSSTAIVDSVTHSMKTAFVEFSRAFTTASATDTYAPDENPQMFQPKSAITVGSGYWVSSGDHNECDIVSYTAMLKKRHRAKGIKINWAYAPGDVRIRISTDCKHFKDSVCWKPVGADRSKVTFESDYQFDRPQKICGVRIDMGKPGPWKYMGINHVGLF